MLGNQLMLFTPIAFTLVEFAGNRHTHNGFATDSAAVVDRGTAGLIIVIQPTLVERNRDATIFRGKHFGVFEIAGDIIARDRNVTGTVMEGNKINARFS
jgi:hypothetical protein